MGSGLGRRHIPLRDKSLLPLSIAKLNPHFRHGTMKQKRLDEAAECHLHAGILLLNYCGTDRDQKEHQLWTSSVSISVKFPAKSASSPKTASSSSAASRLTASTSMNCSAAARLLAS